MKLSVFPEQDDLHWFTFRLKLSNKVFVILQEMIQNSKNAQFCVVLLVSDLT